MSISTFIFTSAQRVNSGEQLKRSSLRRRKTAVLKQRQSTIPSSSAPIGYFQTRITSTTMRIRPALMRRSKSCHHRSTVRHTTGKDKSDFLGGFLGGIFRASYQQVTGKLKALFLLCTFATYDSRPLSSEQVTGKLNFPLFYRLSIKFRCENQVVSKLNSKV